SAARDAGAAGWWRRGARRDEPADAPGAREAAQATLVERVPDPDVGFDVDAAFVLEVDRDEPAGDDVVAILGEDHFRPLLPLGSRARKGHRAGRRRKQLAAEPFVST